MRYQVTIGITDSTNAAMQKPQNTIRLPQPKNSGELKLLDDYSSYLMEQVNEMKLHPSHKEDIKEILLKAMVEITILHEASRQIPKTLNFLFRILRKPAK